MGFFRLEYWNGSPFPPLGDFPNQGIEPMFPALQVDSLSAEPSGKTVQFSSVQSLSGVQFFATPWTAAGQAFLSITKSWSLPKLMSIKSMIPSNHHILCHHPLFLLPSVFPSLRVFYNESVLLICIIFKIMLDFFFCWVKIGNDYFKKLIAHYLNWCENFKKFSDGQGLPLWLSW